MFASPSDRSSSRRRTTRWRRRTTRDATRNREESAAGVTGRLEEAERSARDPAPSASRRAGGARARAPGVGAVPVRCAVLERELLAADSAVAGSIPEGAGDDKEEEEDTEDKETRKSSASRWNTSTRRWRGYDRPPRRRYARSSTPRKRRRGTFTPSPNARAPRNEPSGKPSPRRKRFAGRRTASTPTS